MKHSNAMNNFVFLQGYQPEWPESDEHPEERILRVTNKTKTPYAIISPNPANDLTVVKFVNPCAGNESICIYDLEGQMKHNFQLKSGQREITLIT